MIEPLPRWTWLTLVAGGLALACSDASSDPPRSVLVQSVTQELAVWTRLAITTSATSRAFHGAVYEPALKGVLVFGGRDGGDTSDSLSDTGIATGAAWIALSSPYARRGYVRGVFDGSRGRIVTYGGLNVGLGTTVINFAETWEFNGADSTWALRSATSLPGRRSGYGLAYDTRRKVTVLFGGFDRTWKDDIYEWDGAAWTKACAAAPCSAGPRPSGRALPVFVYDEARGVSVLFGGNGAKGLLGDTWSWDGTAWKLLEPALSPAPRDSGAAAYDPVSERVLLFGGAFADAREAGDFWAWDGKEWERIAQTTTPFNRRGASLAWDVERRRGVLLGGAAEGGASDAWTFVLSGSPCQSTAQCHVGTCQGGTCASSENEGAGGAPDDLGKGGAVAGLGGGAPGGTTGTGGTEVSFGGGGLGGGAGVSTTGGGGGAGEIPVGAHGGTSSLGRDGEAGEPATNGGSTQGRPPGKPDRSEVGEAQSFYACGIGPTPRVSRHPLAAFAALVVLALKRARKRRSRSGSTAAAR
jgi:hypothetical protein